MKGDGKRKKEGMKAREMKAMWRENRTRKKDRKKWEVERENKKEPKSERKEK